MKWEFTLNGKLPKLNKPILIEGLPGIGNVGKVIADFLIDELEAKKLYDIFSYSLPHSVFVNEKNMVELPSISMHYLKYNNSKKNDLILLTGDVQPLDEENSYAFCESILDVAQKLKCKEIITLGGIGLQDVSKVPKVYCTGNDKKMIAEYTKDTKAIKELHGVVGPIVGASGLLLGLGAKRKIPAIALLAETIGHPMYLGIKGSREIMKILVKKLKLKIDMKELDKEIKKIEKEMLKTTQELTQISQDGVDQKAKKKTVSYIG